MTRVGVALGAAGLVLLGVVTGAVLDALLLPSVRLAQRRHRRAEMFTARVRDPRQWRADSVRLAEWEARERASPRHSPREVRRVQAFNNCAISFEFRDTAWRNLQLIHAKVWDRLEPGVTVAEGWAFRERGFDKGDTATVVFPNVYCGDLLVGGYGASMIQRSPPPQLEVR